MSSQLAARTRLVDGNRDERRTGEAGGAAAAVRRPRRIALLEHCGSGNLGDDATVAAVLQQIKVRWPDAALTGLSLDPSDSEARHGIKAFAIRQSVFAFKNEWSSGAHPAGAGRPGLQTRLKDLLRRNRHLFAAVKAVNTLLIVRPAQLARELLLLARALRILRRLDVLIICGGGQLLDWGGPWAFPYTLFKWTLLAKVAGAKCLFLNNGAGPLDHALSRWFIRRALSLADYVSFRDAHSGAFVRRIGFHGGARIVADCAWGLRIPERVAARRRDCAAKTLVIGIAPMAYCDPTRHWVNDQASYRRHIRRLAGFGAWLLRRGHRLSLFSSDIWFDSQAVADLAVAIAAQCTADEADRIARPSVTSIDDLLLHISQLDCYVTCRFHGVVFSHLLGVPALAIAPHPKVRTLMEDAGLAEYCVDIAECAGGRLTAAFERLVDDMEGVRARIRRTVGCCRDALAMQFDELFPRDGHERT